MCVIYNLCILFTDMLIYHNLSFVKRYDVFDHNDPNKTGANWALLPEGEYEAPWFPQGTPCDLAIQRVSNDAPGYVLTSLTLFSF
jgi:hypothetical protein